MADTKLTALSEVSAPALTDIYYIVADPGGTPTSDKITGTRLGGLFVPALCQGRLTTESGVPVSTSNRTSQGTVYWTPCSPSGQASASGLVGFYDGTRYVVKSLTEISVSLSGSLNAVYDLFLDWNSGTPQLVQGPVWTDLVTRATGLATQGPLTVLSGTATKRWVGTVQLSGANVTEDSLTFRFLWNANNQVPRPMSKQETTDSWSYATHTVRYANNTSANRLQYVTGNAASLLTARVVSTAVVNSNTTDGAESGVGVDVSNAFTGLVGGVYNALSTAIAGAMTGFYEGYPGLGYHFLSWLETGATAGSCTFLGDNGLPGTDAQSGIYATILG